jgi:hypothetical protein
MMQALLERKLRNDLRDSCVHLSSRKRAVRRRKRITMRKSFLRLRSVLKWPGPRKESRGAVPKGGSFTRGNEFARRKAPHGYRTGTALFRRCL